MKRLSYKKDARCLKVNEVLKDSLSFSTNHIHTNENSVKYIIIIFIIFMQGIYNYMPETNHVSRVYSVSVVLYLRFVVHEMLFRT